MKVLVSVLIGVTLLMILGTATSWFGLVVSRPMAKYAKETDRQVYMNSITHQQGANSGVAIDCSNMRNSSLALADRKAFASLVIQDYASYGGNLELSVEAQKCLQEANEELSQ